MEYALWHAIVGDCIILAVGLNPCSNGICSLTRTSAASEQQVQVLILVLMEYALWPGCQLPRNWRKRGLNPCSNGICSLTTNTDEKLFVNAIVLILVLMEYALWPRSDRCRSAYGQVLILVLMEYALWRQSKKQEDMQCVCLNPCSNGICSLTSTRTSKNPYIAES